MTSPSMNILGVDPGPEQSALVWWDPDASRIVRAVDLVNDLAKDEIALARCPVAIEKLVSYGQRLGDETFVTIFWTGRFFEVRQDAVLIRRQDIKRAVTGATNVGDKEVREALIARFGPPGSKKKPGPLYGASGHRWAALAAAVAAVEISR